MDPAMDGDPSGMDWEWIPEGIPDPSPRDQIPSALIVNAMVR
jgi:hypothetical protein